jgi:hypothetical protein
MREEWAAQISQFETDVKKEREHITRSQYAHIHPIPTKDSTKELKRSIEENERADGGTDNATMAASVVLNVRIR